MVESTNPGSAHNPLIEALLVTLARQHAPRAAPAQWQRPGDLREPLSALARKVAHEGVLVIVGDRSGAPPEAVPRMAEECAQAYTVLYALLTQRLFARLTGIRPFYHSYSRQTLALFFVAEAPPVIEALAGYVAPYAAAHTPGAPVPARQLMALMDAVLGQLETGALAPAQRTDLQRSGAAVINWMLGRALRQLPLLAYDVPLFPAPPPRPTTLPGIRPAAPPRLDSDTDDSTTRAAPGSDDDTALPPLPPAPGPPPAPGTPPAPVPYRPGRRPDDAGTA